MQMMIDWNHCKQSKRDAEPRLVGFPATDSDIKELALYLYPVMV